MADGRGASAVPLAIGIGLVVSLLQLCVRPANAVNDPWNYYLMVASTGLADGRETTTSEEAISAATGAGPYGTRISFTIDVSTWYPGLLRGGWRMVVFTQWGRV